MIIRAILFVCIAIASPVYVYAQNDVSLQVSQTEVSVDESFNVVLQLRFDEASQIPDISIPGMEYFSIFSQSQSEQIRQIQDTFERVWTLTLNVSPKEIGNFQIGPVTISIDDVLYTSPSYNIEVVSETLLQNSAFEEDWLKPFQAPIFPKRIILVVLVLFTILFYMSIYGLFFSPKNTPVQSWKKQIDKHDETTLKETLQNLQKNIASLSDEEFFEKLHALIRTYISETYNAPNAHSATYKELEPYIADADVQSAFHNSYIHEFNGKKTLDTTKEKIIQKYLDIL